MQNLILITNSYPFGLKEASFLRPEVKALAECFHLTVVSRNVHDEQTSELPTGTEIFRYDSRKDYAPLKLLMRVLFSKAIYQEIAHLIREKQFNFTRLKKALRYCMRAHHFAAYLQNIREKIQGDAVLYTYWNDYSVFSASMVKREGDKLISRAHGTDLYLRADNNGYLPMKVFSNRKTDLLAFVSHQGQTYFTQTFGSAVPTAVFRLGVARQASLSPFSQSETVSVLSFSNVLPVKRLDRMIEAFALLPDSLQVQWTHIGDGTAFSKIQQDAKTRLGSKPSVQYTFLGAMENADALQYIANNQFDFLLNTSESEGLPMTMMESMSFGVPVIGRDVGGVREIVQDGENGFLLPSDADAQALADVIMRYADLSYTEKCRLRENALAAWEKDFNSEQNMRAFSDCLVNLSA